MKILAIKAFACQNCRQLEDLQGFSSLRAAPQGVELL